MTMQDFRVKLDAGFWRLHEQGYFAKQSFWCCQTCGVAAVPDEVTDYVFYHQQDAERLIEEGHVCLCWGGNGEEIARVFRDVGLEVEWDGSKERRIQLNMAKQLMSEAA